MQLRDLRGLDTPDDPGTATVVNILADGSVVVDLGGGQRVPAMCADTYTPSMGALVAVDRRAGVWWVRHGVRTSNALTQPLSMTWPTPYEVLPASSGIPNPLVVAAVETRSWRSNDGWSDARVMQGRWSTDTDYWRGCVFYGDDPVPGLRGRTCTYLRVRIHRANEGGLSGAQGQWIAPHAHGTRPAGQPAFTAAGQRITAGLTVPGGVATNGDLSRDETKQLILPTSWGQDFIDRKVRGFGHLLLATGVGSYSIDVALASDAAQWQLEIGWS